MRNRYPKEIKIKKGNIERTLVKGIDFEINYRKKTIVLRGSLDIEPGETWEIIEDDKPIGIIQGRPPA